MAEIYLSGMQVRLMRSLGLPTELDTDMGEDELCEVRQRLIDAIQERELDARFEKVSFLEACSGVISAIDAAIAPEGDETEAGELARKTMNRKVRIAREVLAEADPMGQKPGLPDGAPASEYDWEGSIIGSCTPKFADALFASRIIAYVLGKSFATDVWPDKCRAMAEEMLSRFPEDYMRPDELGWADLKEIIDERFAEYEEFLPMFLEAAREESDDDYDLTSLVNVHFLVNTISDRALFRTLDESYG